MALTTATELLAEAKRRAKRSNLTNATDYLLLAEQRIIDGFGEEGDAYHTEPVRINAMVKAGNIAINSGDDEATLPSDFLEFAETPYLEGNTQYPLTVVSTSNLRTLASTSLTSNRPCNYAIIGNYMKFPHASDADYTIPASYFALPSLTDNSTNQLLLKRPNIYLFALLLEIYIFTKNDERANQMMSLFKGAVDAANRRRKEAGFEGPLVVQSDGGVF